MDAVKECEIYLYLRNQHLGRNKIFGIETYEPIKLYGEQYSPIGCIFMNKLEGYEIDTTKKFPRLSLLQYDTASPDRDIFLSYNQNKNLYIFHHVALSKGEEDPKFEIEEAKRLKNFPSKLQEHKFKSKKIGRIRIDENNLRKTPILEILIFNHGIVKRILKK